MPLPKIAEIRDLNDEEVAEQIIAVKRELFELRLQKATSRLEKTHEVKHKKHRLAQLLTIEGERKRAEAASQSTSPKEEPESVASSEETKAEEAPSVAETENTDS